MSTSIGKWSTQATLDAQGFTSGINAMTRGANQAKAQLDSTFGGMQSRIGTFFASFRGGATSFGAGIVTSIPAALGLTSISAVMSNLNQQFEEMQDLDFVAQSLGSTVEFLSALNTVASENSVSTQQFTSAVEFMNQRLGEAINGGTEAQEVFQRLGLDFEQLRGQRFDDTFMQVARGLEAIEDRAVRARTARELFGRGGAAGMLRFVEDLDARLADVQGRGGFITEADVERVREMDNAIDRMTTAWTQTWRDWLSTAAPTLTRIAEGWQMIFAGRDVAADNMVASAADAELQSRIRMFMAAVERADATGDQSFIDMLPTGGAIPDIFREWFTDSEGLARVRLNLEAVRAQLQSLAAFAEMDAAVAPAEEFAEHMGDTVAEIFARHARVAEQNAREAERFIDQLQTPTEAFFETLARIQELEDSQNLTGAQADLAAGQAFERLASSIPERTLPRFFEQGSADALSLINRQAIQPVNEQQRIRQILEAAQARDEERNRLLTEHATILRELLGEQDPGADID